jgi:hypothetical protein
LERLDGSALIDLVTVKIEAGSTSLLFVGNILYDGTRTVIVRNFCRESSIIIDKTVEVLAKHAFAECKSVTTISFERESKLCTIQSHAFSKSGLHTICIPRFVEVLPRFSFHDCEFLEYLLFDDPSNLKTIEEFAFSDCRALKEVHLPPSVKFVDLSAFPDDCDVTISGSRPD